MIFPPSNQISRIFLRSSWRSRCDLARRSTRHFRVIFGSFWSFWADFCCRFGPRLAWIWQRELLAVSGHFWIIFGSFSGHSGPFLLPFLGLASHGFGGGNCWRFMGFHFPRGDVFLSLVGQEKRECFWRWEKGERQERRYTIVIWRRPRRRQYY